MELCFDLEGISTLITFNGDRFDIPFLLAIPEVRAVFPRYSLDLYRLAAEVDLKRSQASMEALLGIRREAAAEAVSGKDAPGLFEAWMELEGRGYDPGAQVFGCSGVQVFGGSGDQDRLTSAHHPFTPSSLHSASPHPGQTLLDYHKADMLSMPAIHGFLLGEVGRRLRKVVLGV
ncbi:MAG: ribonuclease H-like domain-containing protein [Armatimonadetes bacterium]|nr:ribonuclease H-like domain-containing protein [Armatimonadota bacterium]